MPLSLKTAGVWERLSDDRNVNISGSPTSGDRMFLWAAWKSYVISVADPSGWTPIGNQYSNGTTPVGNGTGSVKVMAWYKDWVTGDTNPFVNFSPSAPTESAAVVMLWQKSADESWNDPSTINASSINWSGAGGLDAVSAALSIPTSSVVMALVALRDDSTAMVRGGSGIGDVEGTLGWASLYVESPATHHNSTAGLDMSADLGHRFVSAGGNATLRVSGIISAAETGAIKFVIQDVEVAGPELIECSALGESTGSISVVLIKPTGGNVTASSAGSINLVELLSLNSLEGSSTASLTAGLELHIESAIEGSSTASADLTDVEVYNGMNLNIHASRTVAYVGSDNTAGFLLATSSVPSGTGEGTFGRTFYKWLWSDASGGHEPFLGNIFPLRLNHASGQNIVSCIAMNSSGATIGSGTITLSTIPFNGPTWTVTRIGAMIQAASSTSGGSVHRFANETSGNDSTGTGASSSPYKSLWGLIASVDTSGQRWHLVSGIYSASSAGSLTLLHNFEVYSNSGATVSSNPSASIAILNLNQCNDIRFRGINFVGPHSHSSIAAPIPIEFISGVHHTAFFDCSFSRSRSLFSEFPNNQRFATYIDRCHISGTGEYVLFGGLRDSFYTNTTAVDLDNGEVQSCYRIFSPIRSIFHNNIISGIIDGREMFRVLIDDDLNIRDPITSGNLAHDLAFTDNEFWLTRRENDTFPLDSIIRLAVQSDGAPRAPHYKRVSVERNKFDGAAIEYFRCDPNKDGASGTTYRQEDLIVRNNIFGYDSSSSNLAYLFRLQKDFPALYQRMVIAGNTFFSIHQSGPNIALIEVTDGYNSSAFNQTRFHDNLFISNQDINQLNFNSISLSSWDHQGNTYRTTNKYGVNASSTPFYTSWDGNGRSALQLVSGTSGPTDNYHYIAQTAGNFLSAVFDTVSGLSLSSAQVGHWTFAQPSSPYIRHDYYGRVRPTAITPGANDFNTSAESSGAPAASGSGTTHEIACSTLVGEGTHTLNLLRQLSATISNLENSAVTTGSVTRQLSATISNLENSAVTTGSITLTFPVYLSSTDSSATATLNALLQLSTVLNTAASSQASITMTTLGEGISGSVTGVATTSGLLSVIRPINIESIASSLATLNPLLQFSAVGSVECSSTTSGNIFLNIRPTLSSDGSSLATLLATLIGEGLLASSFGTATAQISLEVMHPITSEITGSSVGTLTSQYIVALVASALGESSETLSLQANYAITLSTSGSSLATIQVEESVYEERDTIIIYPEPPPSLSGTPKLKTDIIKKYKEDLYAKFRSDSIVRQQTVGYVYRDTLRFLLDYFKGFSYVNAEDKIIPINCIHANQERAIAKIKEDQNLILPMMSISQTRTDNAEERRRYDSILVNETIWVDKERRAKRVLSFPPRPIDITYTLNLWTEYMNDMDQLYEQILFHFNPSIEVRTQHSQLTKATLLSESNLSQMTVPDREDRILRKSFEIIVEGYIPSPKFLVTSTGKIERINVEYTT